MSHPILNKLVPFLIAAALFVLFVRVGFFLLGLLSPFIVAFIISSIAYPLKKQVRKKAPNSIATLVSIIGILLVISLIVFILWKIVSYLSTFSHYFTKDFVDSSLLSLQNAYEQLQNSLPFLDDYDFTQMLNQNMEKLSTGSFGIAGSLFEFAKGIPSKGFFAIIMMVATFYTTLEYENILYYLKKYIVKVPFAKTITKKLKSSATAGIGTWIKAQGILILINGTIIGITFTFFGYHYGFLLGYAVGLLDALPVFGLGAVLIPMSIYHLIVGNYLLALGSILLYIGCIFIRHAIEPRIIGQSIGINPLLTLIAVYIGFKLWGVLGIFIALIVLISFMSFFPERSND